MTYVKLSTSLLTNLSGEVNNMYELFCTIRSTCISFESDAKEYCDTWIDKYLNSCVEKKVIPIDNYMVEGEKWDIEAHKYVPTGYKTLDTGRYRAAVKAWIQGKMALYKAAINTISSQRMTYIGDACARAQTMKNAINNILASVNVFESLQTSVADIIKKGSNGGSGSWDANPISVDGNTYNFDGQYYTDENGNKLGLGEIINCFYSFIGTTTASVVALASMSTNWDDFDALLKAQIEAVGAQTTEYLKSGYYSVTSSKGIEEMYKEVFGEDYDATKVNEKYLAVLAAYGLTDQFGEIINNGIGGELFSGAAVAGLFAGAYRGVEGIGNGKTGELSPEELEELGLKPSEKDDGEVPRNQLGDDSGGDQGPGGGGPGGSDGPGVDGEGAPGTDGLVLSDEITLPTKDEIPDVIPEAPEMTSEQADDIAVEKFYDQFEDETALAEYRQAHVREFDEMSNDQGALEEFFENAGYSAPEAEYISQNKELGLSAFLAAKQSADLLSMSTQIAQESGMDMTLFDSRFDDRPNYSALSSGDVNSFLTNPNYDADVSAAKAELTTAKTEYDTRVTKANESIQKATEAKEELEKVKEELVKEAGNNTKKWNDKQVEKYNEAAKKYNDSVEQANEDYKAVEEAKTEYEATKENYENVKQEYLDSIKESSSQGQNVQPETDSSITENGEVHVYGNSSEPNVEAAPDNTGTSESVASGNDSFGGEEYVFEDNFISDPNSATDSLTNTNVDNNPGIEVSEDSVVIK